MANTQSIKCYPTQDHEFDFKKGEDNCVGSHWSICSISDDIIKILI